MGLDRGGMIDVGEKEITRREARAFARVLVGPDILQKIENGVLDKGDVLEYSKIAGIMGAKKTPELIPLCHPLFLEQVRVDIEINRSEASLDIYTTVRCSGKTGVEMEALTGCMISALTVYDMCKMYSHDIEIVAARLLEKRGGKSGTYVRNQDK